MENFDQEKYDRARKRIKDIKGFYTHLTIYLIVNSFLILAQTGLFNSSTAGVHMPSWGYFTTPFFWGIGLVGHGLHVFQHKFSFFRNWEERKIKEYMEKDEKEFDETDWS